MPIVFEVLGSVRCDMLVYGSPHITGPRKVARFFPSGHKGVLYPQDVHAIVIRAWWGTRVTFTASPGPDWQEHAWRTVVLLEGHTVPAATGAKLPGVRIPDLDVLDNFDAKRTSGAEGTVPVVERLDAATGWTCGRRDGLALKGRVRGIRLERIDG